MWFRSFCCIESLLELQHISDVKHYCIQYDHAKRLQCHLECIKVLILSIQYWYTYNITAIITIVVPYWMHLNLDIIKQYSIQSNKATVFNMIEHYNSSVPYWMQRSINVINKVLVTFKHNRIQCNLAIQLKCHIDVYVLLLSVRHWFYKVIL